PDVDVEEGVGGRTEGEREGETVRMADAPARQAGEQDGEAEGGVHPVDEEHRAEARGRVVYVDGREHGDRHEHDERRDPHPPQRQGALFVARLHRPPDNTNPCRGENQAAEAGATDRYRGRVSPRSLSSSRLSARTSRVRASISRA